jgi:hypothetical protein
VSRFLDAKGASRRFLRQLALHERGKRSEKEDRAADADPHGGEGGEVMEKVTHKGYPICLIRAYVRRQKVINELLAKALRGDIEL